MVGLAVGLAVGLVVGKWSPNGTRLVECGYRGLVECRTVALGALRDGPAVHSAVHSVVQTGGTPVRTPVGTPVRTHCRTYRRTTPQGGASPA